MIEQTDVAQIITGQLGQLETLEANLATANLENDRDIASPNDPTALKMLKVMQLGMQYLNFTLDTTKGDLERIL